MSTDIGTPYERAVAAAGGVTSLARKLGFSQSRVANWRKRGVPSDCAAAVECAIDRAVTRQELCPSFDWGESEIEEKPSHEIAQSDGAATVTAVQNLSNP